MHKEALDVVKNRLAQVLTKELGGLVGSLQFLKSMRWNSATTFSRPVRWLLAFHGRTLLPFSFADLTAQRQTRGLRTSGPVEISSAHDYRCIHLCSQSEFNPCWTAPRLDWLLTDKRLNEQLSGREETHLAGEIRNVWGLIDGVAGASPDAKMFRVQSVVSVARKPFILLQGELEVAGHHLGP